MFTVINKLDNGWSMYNVGQMYSLWKRRDGDHEKLLFKLLARMMKTKCLFKKVKAVKKNVKYGDCSQTFKGYSRV